MVELIGDPCRPSELIIPDRMDKSANPTLSTLSGALLYASGADIYAVVGSQAPAKLN